MKSEADTAKERWVVLMRIVRESFPNGNIRIIDKGRENRYWKIGIGMKKDHSSLEIFIKIRAKVMTYPEADYKSRFLQAVEEAQRILGAPVSSMGFWETIFVKPEGVYCHLGENLNDDWW